MGFFLFGWFVWIWVGGFCWGFFVVCLDGFGVFLTWFGVFCFVGVFLVGWIFLGFFFPYEVSPEPSTSLIRWILEEQPKALLHHPWRDAGGWDPLPLPGTEGGWWAGGDAARCPAGSQPGQGRGLGVPGRGKGHARRV